MSDSAADDIRVAVSQRACVLPQRRENCTHTAHLIWLRNVCHYRWNAMSSVKHCTRARRNARCNTTRSLSLIVVDFIVAVAAAVTYSCKKPVDR